MSDTEPEQVTEATVSDAARDIDGADALTVARMNYAENRRTDGVRSSLVDRLNSRARQADQALIDAAQGVPLDDLNYVADLCGVDVSIARATRVFLGRTRVDEDELRAAVKHVGAREV